MQETTFPVEILIHDDASTDNTAEIVREYERKHPRLIKPIYQVENQYSKGNKPGRLNRERAIGNFIAVCEGDDHWTCPTKLQRQIDAMIEAHDAVACFHATSITHDGGGSVVEDSRLFDQDTKIGSVATADLIQRNCLGACTCSALVRAEVYRDPKFRHFAGLAMGDWPAWLIASLRGRLLYINEVMAVYNRHSGGVWTGMSVAGQQYTSAEFVARLPEVLSHQHRAAISSSLGRCYGRLLLSDYCSVTASKARILIRRNQSLLSRDFFDKFAMEHFSHFKRTGRLQEEHGLIEMIESLHANLCVLRSWDILVPHETHLTKRLRFMFWHDCWQKHVADQNPRDATRCMFHVWMLRPLNVIMFVNLVLCMLGPPGLRVRSWCASALRSASAH